MKAKSSILQSIHNLIDLIQCPVKYRPDFEIENIATNTARIKWFSRIVMVISIIFIVILYWYLQHFGFQSTPHAIDFHLVNFFVCIIINIFLYIMRNKPNVMNKHGSVLNKIFLIYIGIWTSLISLAAQQTHGQITVFLFGIIFVAILTYSSPLFLALYYITLNGFFSILLLYAQPSLIIRSSHIINSSYFVIIAWLIGAILYNYRIKDFIQKRIINDQIDAMRLLNIELHRLSTVDALTEISNRRGFNESIISEWNRSAREKTPLSLAMVDIDYFKKYNDFYGHLQGDECLKQVAQIISRFLRQPGDKVFRYGGEEMIITMPNTDIERSTALCESIRSFIEASAIPHPDSPFSTVTVSIGIASIIPAPGTSYHDFLNTVDILLYQAKLEGRNQVKTSMQLIEYR